VLALAIAMAGCSSEDPAAPVPDTTPPSLVSVTSTNLTRIEAEFNEQLDPATATEPSNYLVVTAPAPSLAAGNNGQATTGASAITVTNAELAENGRMVILTTSPLVISQAYTLEISGVKDLVGNSVTQGTLPVVNSITDSYGTISLWAGQPGLPPGFNGDGLDLLESRLYQPADLTFTSTGCYVLDWNNHRVRQVTASNTFQTVVGTNDFGDGDPDLLDRVQPVPGLTVDLNHPTGVIELPNGHLLLACWHNHKIREYDPTTGDVWVIIGGDDGFAGDGGPARDARMNFPVQMVLATDGTLYIVDQRNMRIRMVDPQGIMHTFAGNGVQGFSGDGGDPKDAELNFPTGNNPWIAGGLALDANDNVYIADTDNHRIRFVDIQANIITTVAGNGIADYGGDWGDATAASLNYPRDIEMGPDGRLYIADEMNHRIRALDPATGMITTVAGNGTAGYGGEGGKSSAAMLHRPGAIAFDALGNLYIADTLNQVIRKITP
jgi:hypothetical protein